MPTQSLASILIIGLQCIYVTLHTVAKFSVQFSVTAKVTSTGTKPSATTSVPCESHGARRDLSQALADLFRASSLFLQTFEFIFSLLSGGRTPTKARNNSVQDNFVLVTDNVRQAAPITRIQNQNITFVLQLASPTTRLLVHYLP
eukprot:scaffold220_cov169-Amphora_coffeaeformis.AAC.6